MSETKLFIDGGVANDEDLPMHAEVVEKRTLFSGVVYSYDADDGLIEFEPFLETCEAIIPFLGEILKFCSCRN